GEGESAWWVALSSSQSSRQHSCTRIGRQASAQISSTSAGSYGVPAGTGAAPPLRALLLNNWTRVGQSPLTTVWRYGESAGSSASNRRGGGPPRGKGSPPSGEGKGGKRGPTRAPRGGITGRRGH